MAGGNRGLRALRVPLEHLGARVFPDMFSLAQAQHALDSDGAITNPQLRERFELTIVAFLDLVEAAKHYPFAKKSHSLIPGPQLKTTWAMPTRRELKETSQKI